jgi:hypothetical protein
MQIKFEGQEHQIDANTLIGILIHYSAIITEANKELSGGSKSVTVKINAIEKGSFILDVGLQESMQSIFSSGSVSYLASLITISSAAFSLYNKYRGRPVSKKEVEDSISIKIEGGNNTVSVNNITNIYNNRVVREAISSSIEKANDDPNVEGISISGEKVIPVTFKKENFKDLIYTDFDKEQDRPLEEDEYVDTKLVITGLKFDRGGRWSFIYNGFPISMTVKDDALMNQINNGARFGKGDSIRVKLKIIKKYNPDFNAYQNKSYRIEEFYEHIINKRPENGNLDFH